MNWWWFAGFGVLYIAAELFINWLHTRRDLRDFDPDLPMSLPPVSRSTGARRRQGKAGTVPARPSRPTIPTPEEDNS